MLDALPLLWFDCTIRAYRLTLALAPGVFLTLAVSLPYL